MSKLLATMQEEYLQAESGESANFKQECLKLLLINCFSFLSVPKGLSASSPSLPIPSKYQVVTHLVQESFCIFPPQYSAHIVRELHCPSTKMADFVAGKFVFLPASARTLRNLRCYWGWVATFHAWTILWFPCIEFYYFSIFWDWVFSPSSLYAT